MEPLMYECLFAAALFNVIAPSPTTADYDRQSQNQTNPPSPCLFRSEPQNMFGLFSQHGKPVGSLRRKIVIPRQEIECELNTTAVISTFNFTSSLVVGYVDVVCEEEIRVHVSRYNNMPIDNVVGYIKMHNCIMSAEDWGNLATFSNVSMLLVLGNHLDDSKKSSDTLCKAMTDVSSFGYDNADVAIPNFEQIFNCSETFPVMHEMIFQNIAWKTLPNFLQNMFPNLQALDLPYNNLTLPPNIFPWTETNAVLPMNLSRMPLMQNHYVDSESLELQENVFRRTYRLDNNLIHDLSGYIFRGFLHMISLKNNQMYELGSDTFSNVIGLQNINLCFNKLYRLPKDVFKGLTSLRKLDLCNNDLLALADDVFTGLDSLTYLNLANNELSGLTQGVFSKLKTLSVIHLEYNNLTSINENTFPTDSVNLKEIYLHHNPIKILPEFVFWIRSLTIADFHATQISFNNFTDYLDQMAFVRLISSVTKSNSYIDYKKVAFVRKGDYRKIDLSGCNIHGVDLDDDATDSVKNKLLLLLIHFQFIFAGNAINCNCKLLPLTRFIKENVENITLGTYGSFHVDWVCQSPTELIGRHLVDVKPEETYCEVNVEHCPPECTCYRRSVSKHLIVDCRKRDLTYLHTDLPSGELELWYSGNNISEILHGSKYFEHIVAMDLSLNRLQVMSYEVFEMMTNLRDLNIRGNLLAYIPESIKYLHLRTLALSPNPFRCDCKTAWMKSWIVENKDVIKEWRDVTCNVNNEMGRTITEVSDEQFTCEEIVDAFKSVLIPSATVSVVLLLLFAAIVAVYAYRLECKVLLYVYFGIHPFDKDNEHDGEDIDCVVVHASEQTEWVFEHVVAMLEHEDYNYVVCDMARDFVVGFSVQDNLSQLVKQSKRIIFCLTEDWNPNCECFNLAWNIAQEKIKETKSNFGIIITHGLKKDTIKDKDLLRFMKRRRYVDSNENMFSSKVIYYMPDKQSTHQHQPAKEQTVHNQLAIYVINKDPIAKEPEIIEYNHYEESSSYNQHVFISYSDDDMQYVTTVLKPLLEDKGVTMCIPDRDFVPGASKEENILNAIHSGTRTLFILSGSQLLDEWSLFTFRNAYEKSLREKSNHLIVIVRDDVDEMCDDVEVRFIDEEIRQYLKSYVSLHVNDIWFEQKLLNGLRPLSNNIHVQKNEMFVKERCLEEIDIRL